MLGRPSACSEGVDLKMHQKVHLILNKGSQVVPVPFPASYALLDEGSSLSAMVLPALECDCSRSSVSSLQACRFRKILLGQLVVGFAILAQPANPPQSTDHVFVTEMRVVLESRLLVVSIA
jgi:hypothetical protein